MKKTTYAIIALMASGFLIIPGIMLIGRATSPATDNSPIIISEEIFDQINEDVEVVAPDDTVLSAALDTAARNQADTIL